MSASLPLASNVAKAGNRPVRTLEFLGPLLFCAENTQKAFTFPANWKDQPLDICIVRPWARAVALTPTTRPNNNSVRRFIRESLLGSLPAQSCRSCLPRRRGHLDLAPGTTEWERGPPTSNARLASHLQLCDRQGNPDSTSSLYGDAILLRHAAG